MMLYLRLQTSFYCSLIFSSTIGREKYAFSFILSLCDKVLVALVDFLKV